MRKPLNKVALAMWVVAGITLVTEIWIFARTYEISNTWAAPGGVLRFLGSMWELVRSGFVSAGALVAYGTIIELLDCIRWNALRPEDRAAELARPSLWHIARRWPHSTVD
jgi:hypothetical protein